MESDDVEKKSNEIEIDTESRLIAFFKLSQLHNETQCGHISQYCIDVI